MKKKIKFGISFWILLCSLCTAWLNVAAESKELELFHQGNIAYQKDDFSTAIRTYQILIKSGYRSSEVYFNLGNAYFKSDSLAKAIVNYERAKKLNPEDEDIDVNLKTTSIRVVDKMDPVPQIFYKRWLHSLSIAITSESWSILFLVLVWLSFIAALFYILSNSILLKKISFFLIFLFLICSGACFIVAKESHSITEIDKQGIVTASSAYIKSSPGEKGNDLFILHEGAKVDAFEFLNGWQKIRTANGSVGWISIGQLEII